MGETARRGEKVGRTLLVTGGAGFLGANILMQAGGSLTLHAVDQAPPPLERENLTWHTLGLQDRKALQDLVIGLNPDVVVHTAALSDIDFCEANPLKADGVNTAVTLQVAELCRLTGARLIFFSSDSVFDGKKGRYGETDAPEPLNQYARTKIKAEKGIAGILANHVIVRPSLIMGLPVLESGNSFLWRLITALRNGVPSAFPASEFRTPIDVITLSRATLELTQLNFTGVLHLAGNDRLSRYEIARRIASTLGYPAELIVDKEPEPIHGRALRPVDASLDNTRAKSVLATPMRDFDDALRLIVESRGNRQL
jgi:dTDP-4-dehydrorhamnose reductase